jgi:hypothetical protein
MIRTTGLLLAAAGALALPTASAQAGAGTNIPGWAYVDTDGTLLKSQNVLRAERLGPGSYAVGFNSKLKKCAITASLSPSEEVLSPYGEISAIGSSKDSRDVIVSTADSTGAPLDLAFTVVATC